MLRMVVGNWKINPKQSDYWGQRAVKIAIEQDDLEFAWKAILAMESIVSSLPSE